MQNWIWSCKNQVDIAAAVKRPLKEQWIYTYKQKSKANEDLLRTTYCYNCPKEPELTTKQ